MVFGSSWICEQCRTVMLLPKSTAASIEAPYLDQDCHLGRALPKLSLRVVDPPQSSHSLRCWTSGSQTLHLLPYLTRDGDCWWSECQNLGLAHHRPRPWRSRRLPKLRRACRCRLDTFWHGRRIESDELADVSELDGDRLTSTTISCLGNSHGLKSNQ